MTPALHSTVRDITPVLTERIGAIFGDRLIGIYLYGSATYGAFDPGVSDLDLTTVLHNYVTGEDLAALNRMHDQLVHERPQWKDRIEVQYIAHDALLAFRERRSPMANISPGEPLHLIEAGTDWLMNWYLIDRYGVTLTGQPKEATFPAISDDEFVESIRDLAREMATRVGTFLNSLAQSYTLITAARALYTHRTGQHISKIGAVEWVTGEYPEWSAAMQDAIAWRSQPQFDAPATIERAATIVREIVAIIDRETKSGLPASDR